MKFHDLQVAARLGPAQQLIIFLIFKPFNRQGEVYCCPYFRFNAVPKLIKLLNLNINQKIENQILSIYIVTLFFAGIFGNFRERAPVERFRCQFTFL